MAKQNKKSNGTNVGFEETLWAAADKMRNNMDPAEYKHVVLGLIFLKYISDTIEEIHNKIKNDSESYDGQEEDRDAYLSEGAFWVPQEARWEFLKANAKKPEIGKLLDDAMIAIEKDNISLKGVLAKNYARPDLDKIRLGELIDMISTIGLGDKESRSKDILGRVYEYFLGRFAGAEGKGGGEFFTPQSVVKLLVGMLEPYKGRIYDPCCGSGGMFVQSEKFVEAHGGNIHDIAVYGQESNPTTWKLCKMNLAIRGIEGNIGQQYADTFHNDLHKDLKADFILANPPFNISDWGGDRIKDDVRWKYGVPSEGNANYAWIQHMIHHLSPTGIAGFVLANGSLSSNTSGEGEIRKNLIQNGLVDCIVAMPSQLFYTTQIPACLWFVSRDRYNHKFRDRHDEVLFIDARKMGIMVTRKNKELTDEDLERITGVYHSWRNKDGKYEDVKGFCKASKIEEIEKNSFGLAPEQYVGNDSVHEDNELFEDKMKRVNKFIAEHYEKSIYLEEEIQKNFDELGYSFFKNTKFSVVRGDILEKLTHDLFKHWFVNFEFPNNNGKSYKKNGGKMEESDLGNIPLGWKTCKLSDIANVTIGRTPPRMEKKWFSRNPKDIKWISIRDLGNSGMYICKTAEYLTREAVEKFNIPVIPKSTVIVSFKLTVGRVAITSEDMLSNEAIAHIKLKNQNLSIEYLYLALKSFDYSVLASTSSIATAVNSKTIKDILILVPDEQVIRKFTKLMQSIFDNILENAKQVDSLSS